MKLKVISDGTVANTHVINSETNEEVECVTSIKWEIDRDGSFLTIVIYNPEVNMEGNFVYQGAY